MSDAVMLWVAGRRYEVENKDRPWEIIGIFDDEKKAVAACTEWSDFVGSVPLNTMLPMETTDWPGLYYPISEGLPEHLRMEGQEDSHHE